MDSKANKFSLQNEQYAFPYHYLPHFEADGVPMRTRGINWGFEYLCYQLHLESLVRRLAPQSLLEVGCGDGRFIGMMSGIPERIGVDLSAEAIRYAQAFHPEVQFHCMPVQGLDRTFDVVAAIEVLEHVPDEGVTEFIRALAQRTRAGGKIVLSVPSIVVPLNRKHYRHYDEALLRRHIELSGAELKVESVEHVYAVPGWLDILMRYSCSPWLVFEFRPFNRWLWKYIWRRARMARPGEGRHLVATLSTTRHDRP